MAGQRIGSDYSSGWSDVRPETGTSNRDRNDIRRRSTTTETSPYLTEESAWRQDLPALPRLRRPTSTQTRQAYPSIHNRPARAEGAGPTRRTSAMGAPAAPTVFQLLSDNAIPAHTRAEATLEGFSSLETAALTKLVDEIIDALGPIFPPGHNDLLITRKSLPRALAQTVCYGKEATIELNLDAHLAPGRTTLDAHACARIAQTLTHEIVLHTRKEFQEYFSAKRISRIGGGVEGHRDACTPHTRDEYFEASYLVSRRLPAESRPVFASEWRDEINGLARDPETKLSLSHAESAELEQWIVARHRQLEK